MIEVDVLGVSVFGPGLPLWAESVPVLLGVRDWAMADSVPPPPMLLPANERRRAGQPARLALAVAAEAVAMAGLPPAALRCVFASSNGDAEVLEAILQSLTAPDGQVSPTRFHNSVHNAVAANWTIGVASMRPATCVGMHDDTFAAGLLSAAAETCHAGEPVLFCVYDARMPPPLDGKRPTPFPFAAALVLTPAGSAGNRLARLSVRYGAEARPDSAWLPLSPGLASLAVGNPAARSLRLLEILALGRDAAIALPLAGGHVAVVAMANGPASGGMEPGKTSAGAAP